MLRNSLSVFLITLSLILLGGAFYVYPRVADKENEIENYTKTDKYKLEYYLDTRNFNFKIVERPSENVKDLVITNTEGKSIKIDIMRYPADNIRLLFESWVKQTINETETQYSPGNECKYMVINVNIDKYYPFNNINNQQNTNPDFSFRNAIEGLNCTDTLPQDIQFNNLVIQS